LAFGSNKITCNEGRGGSGEPKLAKRVTVRRRKEGGVFRHKILTKKLMVTEDGTNTKKDPSGAQKLFSHHQVRPDPITQSYSLSCFINMGDLSNICRHAFVSLFELKLAHIATNSFAGQFGRKADEGVGTFNILGGERRKVKGHWVSV
jgi:hypothetical protein